MSGDRPLCTQYSSVFARTLEHHYHNARTESFAIPTYILYSIRNYTIYLHILLVLFDKVNIRCWFMSTLLDLAGFSYFHAGLVSESESQIQEEGEARKCPTRAKDVQLSSCCNKCKETATGGGSDEVYLCPERAPRHIYPTRCTSITSVLQQCRGQCSQAQFSTCINAWVSCNCLIPVTPHYQLCTVCRPQS